MPTTIAAADLTDDRCLHRETERQTPELWSSRSSRGMVSSAHYRATRVGAEVLAAGGNAVDAAVATSLALAVVECAGSGIGSMAIMLVHFAEERCRLLSPTAYQAPRLDLLYGHRVRRGRPPGRDRVHRFGAHGVQHLPGTG